MTRKDFTLIATVLKDQKPDASDKADGAFFAEYALWLTIVHNMAGELSITSGFDLNGNRRFQRDRFLAACGIA